MEVIQYIGGYSVHRGDNISTVGDNISTVGDNISTVEVVQYSRDSISTVGGQLQYCGGCSVQWGITSVHAGG